MSQAFGPAQSSGPTLTAGTLTTVYRPAASSSVEKPPPPTRLPLAVAFLSRPAGVVHGVVPEGQRQQEGAHEDQQRKHLQQQREEHHRAAVRLPECEQLAGGTRDIESDQEEADYPNKKDQGFPRLTVVQLTQTRTGGNPGARPAPPPAWGRDVGVVGPSRSGCAVGGKLAWAHRNRSLDRGIQGRLVYCCHIRIQWTSRL